MCFDEGKSLVSIFFTKPGVKTFFACSTGSNTFFLTFSGMSCKGNTHHAEMFSCLDGGKEVTRVS